MKKTENKKIRISITLQPILYKSLNENTSNVSSFIEHRLLDFSVKKQIHQK